MKQLQAWGMVVALSLAAAALAQTETAPQTTPQGSPAPSTSPTEGTAADRTPPGETQTRDDQLDPTVDPSPSTSQTEGTAADTTPPGETAATGSARTAAAGDAKGHRRASKIIGMKVQTPAGESLGQVEDMVLDDSGRISQVVIDRSTAGTEARPATSRLAALPWSEASSMIKADALIIERQRLASAESFGESDIR